MGTTIIAAVKSEYRVDDLIRASGIARSTYCYHLQCLEQPDNHAELTWDMLRRLYLRYRCLRLSENSTVKPSHACRLRRASGQLFNKRNESANCGEIP